MLTPQAGLVFMKQMQQMQQPGGAGIGAPAAGSPTQGLIARMMSDNPGGLIGALMKQNDPNQPGSMAAGGAGPLPAMPVGGMPPMAPGAALGGVGVANPGRPVPGMMPRAPALNANSSGDDIWNSYKAAGGGADLSNNKLVQQSQNAGMGPMGMLSGLFGGGGGMGGGGIGGLGGW